MADDVTLEINTGMQITIGHTTRTKDARGLKLAYPSEEVKISISGPGVRASSFSAPASTARQWAEGILHSAEECEKIGELRRQGPYP